MKQQTMKKKLFILLLIGTLTYSMTLAQIVTGWTPKTFDHPVDKNQSIKKLSYHLDINSIKEKDKQRQDTASVCGIPIFLNIDLLTEATKIFETDSFNLYQLQISSDSALAIGLYFSDFYLPTGYELYAYDENKNQIVGAITSYNNPPEKKFAIQPIQGNKVTIEIYEPKNQQENPILKIDKIAHFYKDIFSIFLNPTFKSSSDCYEDVHCAINNGLERAVFKWVYYDTEKQRIKSCSGVILNQDVSPNNLKPYAYTANHCGKNAELSTAVFYFNYQNPDCNVSGGTTYYTTIGATKRAKKSNYDMFLMELYQTPPPDYNIFYAGWDRHDRNDLFSFVAGIHHPHGGKKAVSKGTFVTNSNPNFWRVKWDRNNAPTARGSSGSPLFEEFYGRVVGVLSYGSSECDNKDGVDRYGKFRKQWSDNGGSDKRLKDWLDPNGNDPIAIDGRDPCFDNLLIQNRIFYPANQYQPFNKVTIQAANTITTSGTVTIKASSEYHFTAGSSITLGPGFAAEAGSNFSVSIAPCTQIATHHKMANITTDNAASEDTIYKIDLPFISSHIENTLRNFPNPFNQKTTIEYALQDEGEVSLVITDVYGQTKSILVNNIYHPKGIYQVDFDSDKLPNGIYFYTIKTPTYSETKKMLLIK